MISAEIKKTEDGNGVMIETQTDGDAGETILELVVLAHKVFQEVRNKETDEPFAVEEFVEIYKRMEGDLQELFNENEAKTEEE